MLLAFSLCYPLVLPYIPKDLPSLYNWISGLGKEDVVTILFGDEVEFMDVISYLQKNSDTLDGVFKHMATLLCLLVDFLFVGDFANRGPMMLLGIVEAVHHD